MTTPADVGIANVGCTAIAGSCAGILGRNMMAGSTNYVIVEARTSGCVTIELEITQN